MFELTPGTHNGICRYEEFGRHHQYSIATLESFQRRIVQMLEINNPLQSHRSHFHENGVPRFRALEALLVDDGLPVVILSKFLDF
jgi:hypothetical protein